MNCEYGPASQIRRYWHSRVFISALSAEEQHTLQGYWKFDDPVKNLPLRSDTIHRHPRPSPGDERADKNTFLTAGARTRVHRDADTDREYGLGTYSCTIEEKLHYPVQQRLLSAKSLEGASHRTSDHTGRIIVDDDPLNYLLVDDSENHQKRIDSG